MGAERCFDDRSEASRAASDFISNALISQLKTAEKASLVVSGGSTPMECYSLLSRKSLPWERIQVTLTDERRVPPEDPHSNEGRVRKNLLVARAAESQLVALDAAELEAMPRPFACTLVGMGEDGHFASLFSDASNLGAALDLQNPALCLPVETAASPYIRNSMTLSCLLQSRVILLLVFGEAKRRILEAPESYPVGHLLGQTKTPVEVFWSP